MACLTTTFGEGRLRNREESNMVVVLLVLVVGACCVLLPLLIVFGMSQSNEDRGRWSEVPFLRRGNAHNRQRPLGLTEKARRKQDGTGRQL